MYLEKVDLAKIFRAAQAANSEHHMIALCGFFTGARISQILALKGEDVFESNGRIVIKVGSRKRGATAMHTLHVDENAAFDMSPLIALAKQRGASLLFPTVSRQYYNLCLKKYAASVGIHSDFAHSHVFRHSAAMAIWDGTQRLGAISQFLQHKSPTTALFYLAESDGRQAQNVMDNFSFADVAA